jgi:predicted glycosyltransferase
MRLSARLHQNVLVGEDMKIWYDACTGKHVRYGAAIAKILREMGHEIIFTTREHPDTVALAKMLGETPIIVGRYNPSSLYERLMESSSRTLQLLGLFKDKLPDIAVSHQSVELCRVAFGLNIPILLTADTPHAKAVNKLTIPLADVLITSKAIPKAIFKRYGAHKIVQFDGIDEVAWVQSAKFLKKYEFPKPLIVVRQMETKAAYALGRVDVTKRLAKKLANLGNVLFIPRYTNRKIEGVFSTEEFMDTVALASEADLVVSVGGTIAREAALLGTPSIVLTEFGRTYVNKYLAQKGFPMLIVRSSEVLATAEKHLGKKWDVKDKLAKMENPVDVIQRIIKENFRQKD